MLRKIASLSVALIVAAGVMVAVPAQAATKVSNGVACSKSGSTTKVGSVTYRCAKNPLVSSTKLTWLTLDCLATANAAVKAQKALSTTTAKFNAEVLAIDLKIAELKPSLDEIQAKLDKAKARLPEASSDLAAAKIKLITVLSASEKVTATKAVTDLEGAVKNWTAAAKAYTSQINQIQSAIKLMERSRSTLLSKPAELASNVSIARENAKLICYKGL